MPQKKTKAQKAADKAFIEKIKTIGINLGGGKSAEVEVQEIDGPPMCDACKSELEADGPPVGFLVSEMKGKTLAGPVYRSRHKKKRERTEEQSFAA